jgi:hypothetical protein
MANDKTTPTLTEQHRSTLTDFSVNLDDVSKYPAEQDRVPKIAMNCQMLRLIAEFLTPLDTDPEPMYGETSLLQVLAQYCEKIQRYAYSTLRGQGEESKLIEAYFQLVAWADFALGETFGWESYTQWMFENCWLPMDLEFACKSSDDGTFLETFNPAAA